MPAHIKYPIVNGKKQCGKCGEWKTMNQYKKARKYYAASCVTCRSAYDKEYRQRPKTKAATREYHRAYMADPKNRKRANENLRRYRKKPEFKPRRNAWRRAWTAKEKQKAIDYAGGKCVCCGYSGCPAALDFHHKDRSMKDGYGTGALKAHWTFDKNKKEIDKCVLVCVRCHREIHAGFRAL